MTTLEQGQLFAERYLLGEQLGEGGMGVVFAAVDRRLGKKPVVIKILRPEFTAHQDHVDRFLNEAHAAAAVHHENIVDVTDCGLDQATRMFFICYERLQGCELLKYIEERSLALASALDIMFQVCAAIEAAHAQGIVHRDLKPENIFIVMHRHALHVKVLDFGIAKILDPSARREHRTQTGVMIGTPNYMSYEQLLGTQVDVRTDVHALGAILYEIVTGEQLFQSQTPAAIALEIQKGAWTLASDPELETIIRRATHRERDERYPTVKAFDEVLHGYAEARGLLVAPVRGSNLGAISGPPVAAVATSVPPVATAPTQLQRESPGGPEPRPDTINAGVTVPSKPHRARATGLAVGGLAVAVLGLSLWVVQHRSPPNPTVLPTPRAAPPTWVRGASPRVDAGAVGAEVSTVHAVLAPNPVADAGPADGAGVAVEVHRGPRGAHRSAREVPSTTTQAAPTRPPCQRTCRDTADGPECTWGPPGCTR